MPLPAFLTCGSSVKTTRRARIARGANSICPVFHSSGTLHCKLDASSDTNTVPHILIFGLGYVGHRLARQLVQQAKVQVSVVSRIPIPNDDNFSCPMHFLDSSTPTCTSSFIAHALESVTTIISTVPPDSANNNVIDPVLALLEPHLSSSHFNRARRLKKIIYLSSTSVYGELRDPKYDVTEQSPTAPLSPKSRHHLRAEKAWLSLGGSRTATHFRQGDGELVAYNYHVAVFRLAGIYGPSRSMLHTIASTRGVSGDIENDKAIVCRIHVDDAVSALTVAALQKTIQDHQPIPTVINLADDCPASRAEVFSFAVNLLANCSPLSQPDDEESTGRIGSGKRSPSARGRYRTSKRISNELMKALLLPELKYPTFREGLVSIATEQFGLQL